MDEILASIRKIIGDDVAVPADGVGAPSAPAGPPLAALPLLGDSSPDTIAGTADRLLDADALRRVEAEVTQQVGLIRPFGAAPADPGAPRPARPLRPQTGAVPAPHPAAEGPSRPVLEPARRRDLVSPGVDAAVSAAFERLGSAMMPARERTVEDLMKEILRPMLKTWLDANLPALVERLVQQEIERISRTPR